MESYDHVQAHSFEIKDLITVLHSFPWLWEGARVQLDEDTYLQQWTQANNQDGTMEYEQLVDETNGDNLQDGMGDGDPSKLPQLPDGIGMHDDAQDPEEFSDREDHMQSIKDEMNQLLDRYRRLQVEQKELEASGAVFEDLPDEE